MRLRNRASAKITVFSLILYLEWNNKLAEFRNELPTFFEIFVLSVFFGSMGLIDELYDTVKIVKV